ncbi:OST-HTH/LOTUS domain-containing protein [Cryobacterium sp. PH31-AA6]|nr:OST-HTH/LOTUS domain-containing protein [Cryobacterium sp. PH31-AA6]MDJ0324770.1 OST-HTH/LOTUS domain-containing protein [Cryobacterium sp. PH31-AA6]
MEHLAPNNLEWQHASTLKSTMRQLDPTFQENSLGFSQFGEFLKSRHQTVEIQERTGADPILLKLRS